MPPSPALVETSAAVPIARRAIAQARASRVWLALPLVVVVSLIVTYAAHALAHIPNCSQRGGVWISDLNDDGSGACVRYDADHQIHEVKE